VQTTTIKKEPKKGKGRKSQLGLFE